MKNARLIISGLFIGLAAGILGFYWHQQTALPDQTAQQATAKTSPSSTRPKPADLQGTTRPDFSLPDRHGQLREISEWNNRVVVINFWATWCPPCRDEIPAFVELQEKYGNEGLQFIGIALEKPDDVVEFAEEMGINYPILAGELEAIRIAKQYGNTIGALPYTVIIDRNQVIRHVQQGILPHDKAEALITALL